MRLLDLPPVLRTLALSRGATLFALALFVLLVVLLCACQVSAIVRGRGIIDQRRMRVLALPLLAAFVATEVVRILALIS